MGDNQMSIYVAQNPATAVRPFDKELIIMSTQDSTLFTLNEVAAEIWLAADGRTPLHEIVQNRICSQFDVEREQALADAEELCRELAKRGILLISDEPSGAPAGNAAEE
jgi:hypothetical protein